MNLLSLDVVQYLPQNRPNPYRMDFSHLVTLAFTVVSLRLNKCYVNMDTACSFQTCLLFSDHKVNIHSSLRLNVHSPKGSFLKLVIIRYLVNVLCIFTDY